LKTVGMTTNFYMKLSLASDGDNHWLFTLVKSIDGADSSKTERRSHGCHFNPAAPRCHCLGQCMGSGRGTGHLRWALTRWPGQVAAWKHRWPQVTLRDSGPQHQHAHLLASLTQSYTHSTRNLVEYMNLTKPCDIKSTYKIQKHCYILIVNSQKYK
jgi:hypothetical protein